MTEELENMEMELPTTTKLYQADEEAHEEEEEEEAEDEEEEAVPPVEEELDVVDNVLVFNPYNSKNQEITENDVKEILRRYGLPGVVNNIELYRRAFVHKSYVRRVSLEDKSRKQKIVFAKKPEHCVELKSKSNDRLEYLGDGVLELTAKLFIYRRFPKENEGFLTDKKIIIVKNETIGKIAIQMNLNRFLLLSRHAEEKNIRLNVAKNGCLFEAFLGAMFLDMNKLPLVPAQLNFFPSMFFPQGLGFQMTALFIENVFAQHLDLTDLIYRNDNYKNILQVKIQKLFKVTPYYAIANTANENIYEVGYIMHVYLMVGFSPLEQHHNASAFFSNQLHISSFSSFDEIKHHLATHNHKILLFLGQGQNKNKKRAEQQACFCALLNLKHFA